jgi:Na+/melibiose symporter-like transporter
MEQAKTLQNQNSKSTNLGKRYQIILFPFNNAATNCYFALLTFITYYGGYYLSGSFVGGVLSATAMAALTIALSWVVTAMRIFDGITDPIVGAMIDKTNGKLGKFRPYMIVGNIMMAVSILAMFFLIRPIQASWLRWTLFILCYVIWVLGYTCQCACTKAGQTCITNDPKQRSQFVIWNMLGMIGSIVLVNLIGNGLLPIFINPVDAENGFGAQYNPQFYNILVPIVVLISAFYTVLALIAIWKKDRPEYWGIDTQSELARFRDYIDLLKNNKQILWLVLSAGCNKLAATIATSGTVAILVYYIMMGNYNGLYLPMYALSFVFMAVFFFIGTKTAGSKGQKRAVTQYTAIAFLFYIGLVVLLSIWDPNNSATHLSLIHWAEDGSMYFKTNLITIIWIVFFGCGYGAYNLCSEMCIPMIADCTDYETYRSGRYVPGIMGTLFSLIDKLVSSFATLLISVFTVSMIPALNGKLPSTGLDLTNFDFSGVKLSAIICFCLLPMIAWVVTLLCMYFYKLSGEKLREIQAVNAVRKDAIAGGMPKEEAMKMWQTIDQVPAEYVQEASKTPKENFMDKIYNKIWGKKEKTKAAPSSNAIEIPAQYRK